MEHSYWSSWYAGWGWFLWIGTWFLMISSFGNWGYTYRVHRRYGDLSLKTARDILNERYAKGEILSEEFHKMKSEITANSRETDGSSPQIKIMPSVNPA